MPRIARRRTVCGEFEEVSETTGKSRVRILCEGLSNGEEFVLVLPCMEHRDEAGTHVPMRMPTEAAAGQKMFRKKMNVLDFIGKCQCGRGVTPSVEPSATSPDPTPAEALPPMSLNPPSIPEAHLPSTQAAAQTPGTQVDWGATPPAEPQTTQQAEPPETALPSSDAALSAASPNGSLSCAAVPHAAQQHATAQASAAPSTVTEPAPAAAQASSSAPAAAAPPPDDEHAPPPDDEHAPPLDDEHADSAQTSANKLTIASKGRRRSVFANKKQEAAMASLCAQLEVADPDSIQAALDGCEKVGCHPWRADPQNCILPPLHYAVRNGTPRILRALLELGAKMQKEGEKVEMPENKLHHSPLLYLCTLSDRQHLHHRDEKTLIEMARMLIDSGADVDFVLKSKKWTPLQTAAEFGAAGLARLLLERGSAVDLQDAYGLTALHWACECDVNGEGAGDGPPARVVSALLEYKADPSIRNNKGKTALDVAYKHGLLSVITLLGGTPPETAIVSVRSDGENEFDDADAMETDESQQPVSSLDASLDGARAVKPSAPSRAQADGGVANTKKRPSDETYGAEKGASKRRKAAARAEDMTAAQDAAPRPVPMAALDEPPNRKRKLSHAMISQLREDAVCGVCAEGESVKGDQIVFCDGNCGVCVHQNCYRTGDLPDGDWFCDVCADARADAETQASRTESLLQPPCTLCWLCLEVDKRGYKTEPMLRVRGGGFAHSCCVLLMHDADICEPCESDPLRCITYEPLTADEEAARRCELCGSSDGVCKKCEHKKCQNFMHAVCARKEGLLCMVTEGEKRELTIKCKEHALRSSAQAVYELQSFFDNMASNAPHEQYLSLLEMLGNRQWAVPSLFDVAREIGVIDTGRVQALPVANARHLSPIHELVMRGRHAGMANLEPLLLLLHFLVTVPSKSADAEDEEPAESASERGELAPRNHFRWLRHCGCNSLADSVHCDGGDDGDVAALSAQLSMLHRLDACPHSPFACALAKGEVERALFLYSLSKTRSRDTVSCNVAHGAAGVDLIEAEAVTDAEVESVAREMQQGRWKRKRVWQLLALLWARKRLPKASEQLRVAAAVTQEAVFIADDLRIGGMLTNSEDPSALAERFVTRSAPQGLQPQLQCAAIAVEGDQNALPPFLYVSECVPYDALPRWLNRWQQTSRCSERESGRCGDRDPRRHLCHFGCCCASNIANCRNRLVVTGVAKMLVLFQHPQKGWGVKAAEPIKAGEFVCEYVGELISEAEAKRRAQGCPDSEAYFMTINPTKSELKRVVIDAYAVRNVAAFINFSCAPNLEFTSLTGAHQDGDFPRVGFFAREDIQIGTELGYRRDVNDRRGGELVCHCGASLCKGKL